MGHDEQVTIASLDMAVIDGIIALEKHGLIGFFSKQVGILQEKGPGYVEQIALAIAHGDCEGLINSAHKFSGFASSIGAKAVGKICRDLEVLGYSGSLESATTMLNDLTAALQVSFVELEAIARTRSTRTN